MSASTRAAAPPSPPRTAPSVPAWVLLGTLGVVAAYLVRLWGAPDDDLWLHLRIGEALRDGTRFQVVPDPLVAIADQPYVPTQWLSEVVGSWVVAASGLDGIRVLRALAVVVLLGAVVLTARTWTTPARSAGIGVVTALATSAAWAERPQLAGLVLEAVTVLLWSRTLRDGRPRWWLVPLTWVWAMVHGSWVIGLATGAVMAVALALERPRPLVRWPHLALLLGGCALAPAVTPLGPVLWLQPFTVNSAARATVNEWQAPALTNPLLVTVGLAAAFVLYRSLRRRPVDLVALLLAGCGVLLAAYAVRTIAFGALLLVPAMARALATPDPAPVRRAELWPALLSAVVFLAFPGVVWAANGDTPLGSRVDASLAALPEGSRTAVDVRVSGWVLWDHPQVLPMRDLRAEVYSPGVAAEYESFWRAEPGWQSYAATHEVAAALTDTMGPLATALAGSGDWQRRASDGTWVLWTRAAAAGGSRS